MTKEILVFVVEFDLPERKKKFTNRIFTFFSLPMLSASLQSNVWFATWKNIRK